MTQEDFLTRIAGFLQFPKRIGGNMKDKFKIRLLKWKLNV